MKIKNNNNKVIKFILFAAILLVLYYIAVSSNKDNSSWIKTPPPSNTAKPKKEAKLLPFQEIIYANSPIMGFTGKVIKIEGNKLYVSKNPLLNEAYFTVDVTRNTKITETPVVFFFKSQKYYAPAIPFSKITKGEIVTVHSPIDLKLLMSSTIKAKKIEIQLTANSLKGKIQKVGKNVLYIKAYLPGSPKKYYNNEQVNPIKMVTYKALISPTTEISLLDKHGKPIKVSLTSLKPGMYVIAYAKVNLDKVYTFKALRIEPLINK